MPLTLQQAVESIHFFAGAAGAALAALALVRLQPWQKPLAMLVLAAVMAAAYPILSPAGWIAAGAVCTGAVCLLFRPGAYYAAAASLLAGLFMGLYLLIYRYLFAVGAGTFPALCLPYLLDLLVLACAGLCCRFGAALLPDASALPVVSDHEQRRRLRVSLFYICAALILAVLWTTFALAALGRLTGWLRAALVLLTAALSALLLGCVRRLAFGAVERIEALVDKQYQNDLLSFMQVIRSQRHDFNFHMRTVSALIGQKQYAACDEYVRQMVENTAVMNDMLPLHHPATSAIIHAFWEMALQRGIAFEVNISSDLAQMPCTVYETNTVIGNLLQNAIDELEQARSQGPIRLLILFRGGYYIIRVSNPCSKEASELQNMFQPGYSTKQSHEGLGLAAVRRIADRYDGAVFPEFGQGMIHLIVQIPFCA